MINSLKISNFQSHRETELLLDDGLNVLVGSSDKGKSAILRAISWAVNNRPKGTSFIRKGSKSGCEVTLKLNGNTLSRFRKGTNNQYVLDGEVFEALGSDVPPKISAILNFSPINTQMQIDRHFLILDSPGSIAGQFNDVVHLDDVGEVVRGITKDLRAKEIRYDFLNMRLDSLEKSLANLSWLSFYEGVLVEEEKLKAEVEVLEGKISALKKFQSELSEAEKLDSKADFPNVVSLKEAVGEVLDVIKEIRQEDVDKRSSEKLRKALKSIEIKLADLDEKMKTTQADQSKLLEELENCPTCEQPLNPIAKKKVLAKLTAPKR